MEDRIITDKTGFAFGLTCGSRARFGRAGRNTWNRWVLRTAQFSALHVSSVIVWLLTNCEGNRSEVRHPIGRNELMCRRRYQFCDLVLGSAEADPTAIVKSYLGSNEDAVASSRDDHTNLWLRFGWNSPRSVLTIAKWGFTISVLDLPVKDGPAFRPAFVGENGSHKVCELANMTLRERALAHIIKTGDHAGK
jgi:hypothetical protein